MNKLIVMLVMLLAVFFLSAQQRNCGTMERLNYLKQTDSFIDMRMQQEENAIQNWINNNPESSTSTIITIPVVVHVVYKTSIQNISNAQIQSQIDILNEDFRKQNSDASSIPSAFSGVAADCQIEFCLAVRDPNGNATTGITRTYTTTSSFSSNDNVKHSSSGGKDAWSTSDYLNIWVCNLSSLLGYAQFPNSGPVNEDGIVVDYAYFGDIGTATSPFDKGRTATHEVGHWLNLRHIWGDATCGTDYVSDTPTHEQSNYGCPIFPHTSNCSGNGTNGDMFMNYMDYTNDACMYMFTAGQKTRMRATLNGSRSSLLTSNGCVPVNVPIVVTSNVTNVSCNSATLGVNNNGAIDLTVTGGLPPFTYSWSNGSVTQDINNLTVGSYSVTITDAQGQVSTSSFTIIEPSAITISYTTIATSGVGASDGTIYTSTLGGTPPYSYYWVSPYSTAQNLINIPAGNYTFYAIDANSCYEVENITLQDGVVIPLSVSGTITDVSCPNAGDGAIDISVSGGTLPYTYSWSNGGISEDLTALVGGVYTLIITDALGQIITSSFTVQEDSSLTMSYNITHASGISVADGAIDMSVNGGQSPYNYFWNTVPSQSTEDVNGLLAGDYVVYVGYNNWACFVSDTVVVGVSATNNCTTSSFPTNIHTTNIIHDRATINWNNMNSNACTVDQYRIKYRELGTTAWSSKTMGAPVGSCTFGTNKTDKLLLNLSPSTTYEYQMKAWYCGGSASSWSTIQTFTTLGGCPNIINLQVSTPTTTKATFTWDTTAAYSFARIKARVDVTGSSWFNVGGFGVLYPTLTKNKNGLVSGTSYRAQARTWCDPNGGAYRSATWTSPIFWTQPSSARMVQESTAARKLLRVTDLLGKEVNPNKVIDKTTLLYIYDDGTVEKKVVIE